MTTLLTSCETPAANECAWVKQIITDAGAADRLTRAEQEQVVAHNRKVKEFCR